MTELASTPLTGIPATPRSWARRALRSVALIAAAAVAVGVAGAGLTASPASAATTGCTVDVVAHPDDDLFFQNPAVQADITAGKCISTVYVTSGDAGMGTTYSRNREKGVQAAYAKMAGVLNLWITAPVTVNGKSVTRSYLVLNPKITLTFLRLPDGNMDGSGTTVSGGASLEKLYLGDISTLSTVDTPAASYTSASLVATLGAIMTSANATTLRTLDYLGDYDEGDHSDHYTVARYAVQARAKYVPSAALVGYLGYTANNLSNNVVGSDLTAKQNTVLTYAPYDSQMCQSLSDCSVRSEGTWFGKQHLATETHTVKTVTPGNVAGAAFVTSSSSNIADGQTAKKAVDGVVDGYPGVSTAEWAGNGTAVGTWLQLNWLESVQLDTVVLYDRPNASDQVTGGTLTFSDGSTVAVPALDNAGGPTVVHFSTRSTSTLRFTATSVSATTKNVGLAELQAWTAGSTPVLSPAPTDPTKPVTPVVAAPKAGSNAALSADVTASGDNPADAQTADKVADGVIDGYPGDYTAEWATAGGTGSWVQLNWATPVALDHVVLFDRPNLSDQITSGTLTFSDGSTVPVGSLTNEGSGDTVAFSARTVTSVRLTVTGVSATTGNVGLAEFQAFVPSTATTTAPVTTAPVTTAPVTTAPVTTAPVTTAPVTTPAAPTTAAPTTSAPTTSAPVTTAPVTTPAAPTTAAPTTSAPVTTAPVTKPPTTTPAAPTTSAPATTTATVVTTTSTPVGADLVPSSKSTMSTSSAAVGSWLQLTWTKSTTVGRIVFRDPSSTFGGITSVTLTFSDGSVVTVPTLKTTTGLVTATFPARATTSVKVTVTAAAASTTGFGNATWQVYAG